MRYEQAGWVGVVAVAVVADLLGDKTMSELFRETARHPVGRPVLIGTWAVLTAHLFGLIPPSRDPIHLGFRIAHGYVRMLSVHRNIPTTMGNCEVASEG